MRYGTHQQSIKNTHRKVNYRDVLSWADDWIEGFKHSPSAKEVDVNQWIASVFGLP